MLQLTDFRKKNRKKKMGGDISVNICMITDLAVVYEIVMTVSEDGVLKLNMCD